MNLSLVAGVGGWLAFAVAVTGWLLWRQTLAARAEDVARACHELRGPLAAVRLGLELSSAREAGPGVSLRAIELELDRAAVALDDLQGVSRRPELVDVEAWLRDSVEAWRPVAARRGLVVGLRCHGPLGLVAGERARLAQATGNLIANAVEHGAGAVEVRAFARADRVYVTVRDNGPGLSPEISTWLARPPTHTRRLRAAGPGRGRGLLIVRAVATAHGGRLTAEPCERGASFVLDLPVAAPPQT